MAVCLYALAVLLYVPFTPDIGIRCEFKPFIIHVSRPASAEGQPMPQPRAELVRVGRQEFKSDASSWANAVLLRELVALQERPIPDLGRAGVRVENRNGERVLIDAQRGDVLATERADGTRLVTVRFRQGSDVEQAVACELRHLPLSEMMPSVLWFCLKFGLFAVGALVFWKRPQDDSAAQFFVLCIFTLGAYIGGYHWTRLGPQPALLLTFMACAVLLPAVTLHFFLIFPRPKAFLRDYRRWVLAVVYGVPLAFLAALVARYFVIRWAGEHAPQDVDPAWSVFESVIQAYLRVAAVWYLASVACLLHSRQSAADPMERNQVKWILYGAVLSLAPLGYTLYLIFAEPDDFAAGKATWPMFTVSVFFTAAFAISITRYRLMELDKLVGSGVVYLLISCAALVVGYGVVFVGTFLSQGGTGAPSLGQAVTASVTAVLLVVLLDLARTRVKKALDRRFFREKHQLDRTFKRMGQAIQQLVDPPTLARRLLQASAEVLGASRGAVYLEEGDPPLYRLADAVGAAPPLAELAPGCPVVEALRHRPVLAPRHGGPADLAQRQLRHLGGEVAHPLVHEDRLVAFLVLGPKDRGAYGPDDLNLLGAFAQLTALALENARGHQKIEGLNRDLRAKVEKISEQQRRILALQSQLTKGALREPGAVGPAEPAPAAAPAANGDAAAPPTGRALVGSSPAMRQVLELVRKAAANPSAGVLIRGESGTGKELLARALHDQSPRAGKAFVKVICASLSPGLLESELFGHVKGAFTGAHRDKVGRFELADGGTLFLDEIGDISWEVQTKLLRVLDEATFERVGSSEPVKVDVRVVAATHRNLEELIRQNRFREDLYYRLKVIDLGVPPVRERREDIPELVQHFLRLHTPTGTPVPEIDDDALAVLKAAPWPGNVRQLEHVIQRAVVVAEGPVITALDLPADLVAAADGAVPEPADWSGDDTASVGIKAEREERGRQERERLVRALAAASGNKAEAARALGLARSTLLSRLKKYGLS